MNVRQLRLGITAVLFTVTVGGALLPSTAGSGLAQAKTMTALGPQGLSDAEVDTIKQTIVAWTAALVKGDLDAWNSYWAEDAVLLAPGKAPIVGDAKRDALAKTPPYDDIAEATFSDWAITGSDNLAVVNNTITVKPKSGAAPSAFKQIIVMRRGETGGWLVQAVIFNAAGSGD